MTIVLQLNDYFSYRQNVTQTVIGNFAQFQCYGTIFQAFTYCTNLSGISIPGSTLLLGIEALFR